MRSKQTAGKNFGRAWGFLVFNRVARNFYSALQTAAVSYEEREIGAGSLISALRGLHGNCFVSMPLSFAGNCQFGKRYRCEETSVSSGTECNRSDVLSGLGLACFQENGGSL